MVFLRLAERVAICLLLSAGLVLVLMGWQLYRGRDAGFWPAAILTAAAIAGAVWGWNTRPTRLRAAIEADRQLRLSDLLSTAEMLRREPAAEGMASAVLAQAQSACGRIAPSTLSLRRLGPRVWGGLGVSLGLVIMLGLLGNDPARGQAELAAASAKSWQAAEDLQRQEDAARAAKTPDLRRPPTGPGGDEADPIRSEVTTPKNTDPNAAAARSTESGSTGGAVGGTGSGSGQTSTTAGQSHTADPATPGVTRRPANGVDPRNTGTGAGGTGAAQSGTDGAGGSTGASSAKRPTPPWRSADWSGARAVAAEAVRSGAVPDPYRAMVRDYFEQP